MEIKGLNLSEISEKLKPHVAGFFTDSKILDEEGGMFQESVTLYADEVRHLIPPEHNSRFKDTDKFGAASGYIRFETKGTAFRGKLYIVMLLHTSTHALLLYLQEQNDITHDSRNILLVDFLEHGKPP